MSSAAPSTIHEPSSSVAIGDGEKRPLAEEEGEVGDKEKEAIRKAIKDAAEMKDEGNKFFSEKNWTSAITAYKQGLSYLPLAPPKARAHATTEQGDQGSNTNDGSLNKEQDNVKKEEETPGTMGNRPLSPSPHQTMMTAADPPFKKECSEARVILYANIAACELKLEAWEATVSAATSALDENPHHTKSLWRRAKANEAIDSWSSLTAAQNDYTMLKEIVGPSDPLHRDAVSALKALEPRIEIVRKRDTDKMMGQLKDVGNSVLGWFGLSTDNFQMTPNGEGGYSMNFVNRA
ncbi:hypothetical protein FRC19_010142 [Serendipita sp. 401]|nr:hypothetical protein FRC15_009046 [Serendipita sp. 397]KAG8819073.1 hypothetical protein FRC19_010142 [Serendipita sp. 401]KAG8866122.1 hypothetical protein FRC20_009042 [Serendipita sp. 405]